MARRNRKKVRATAGSTVAPINPGFGAMRTGPGGVPQGGGAAGPVNAAPQAGTMRGNYPETHSQYQPIPPQPPNYIEDVDLGANWFSPFQPITPFGPPYVGYAREWDYPVGTNLDYIPQRLNLFQQFRGMAETWGVLRTIIETRKDQFLTQEWEFQVRGKPRIKNKYIDHLNEVFRKPDGKRSFDSWMRLILEDLLVIDAPAIDIGNKNRAGQPMTLSVLDGATIKPLIDDAGRTPDYPQPAYQQIIKGLPMINMDERDLLYAPMRPRTQLPIFGYSPVEQIYIEITEAIRKTFYQLNFWVEGNLPDLLMSVPENWNVKQIAQFQALMDANLSGNLREKSKIRFVPHGMQPYDIKNSAGQDVWAARDEILIRLACFAFSISPQPFLKQMNRASAQTAQDAAKMEGLFPLNKYVKTSIMDHLIQEHFGYDEIEYVIAPQADTDQLKRSQVYVNYAKAGLKTINEIRDEMNLPPVTNGDKVLIYTNNGVMVLDDAIKASALAATAPKPDSASGTNTGATMQNPRNTQSRNPPQNPKVIGHAPDEDNEGLETPDDGGAEIVRLFSEAG